MVDLLIRAPPRSWIVDAGRRRPMPILAAPQAGLDDADPASRYSPQVAWGSGDRASSGRSLFEPFARPDHGRNPRMAYEVPALPYDFAALEPHIDAKTMEIHHDKHHQAYVDKVNAALE